VMKRLPIAATCLEVTIVKNLCWHISKDMCSYQQQFDGRERIQYASVEKFSVEWQLNRCHIQHTRVHLLMRTFFTYAEVTTSC
jgi:hypothetical protein